MSHQNASVKSILFALLANLGIAITKTVAAVITGSGAMLAESIHLCRLWQPGFAVFGIKSFEKETKPGTSPRLWKRNLFLVVYRCPYII